MDPSQTGEQTRPLDDFIEAFESAWARGLRPEVEEFLPAADHPLRRQVLDRLIRLDLRHRWAQRQPCPLADYQGRFPEWAADPAALEELKREEEELRRHGEADTSVLPEEVHSKLEEAAQAYQRFRLKQVLKHDQRPLADYYAGCVFAQTSCSHPDDRVAALAYLRIALRRGFGLKRLGEDRDLEPLADDKEFRKLRAAASLLATGDMP
jgi:hypothetical protein